MITVLFQTESHYPIKGAIIKDAITQVLTKRMKGHVEVSVTIVGDRKMKKLNQSYRQKDSTTDVLSFPQHDPSQPERTSFIDPPGNTMYLGDIIISYPQAVLEASEQNKMVDDMIVFLALHGLDHLMGIHHPE